MDAAAAIVTALAAASSRSGASSTAVDDCYQELRILLSGGIAASLGQPRLAATDPAVVLDPEALRRNGLSSDPQVLEKVAELTNALLSQK
jgi:hypothetical protein